jgi:hypothetical protein
VIFIASFSRHSAARSLGEVSKRRRPIPKHVRGSGVKMSAACRDGRCGNCFALTCEHGCHKRGA